MTKGYHAVGRAFGRHVLIIEDEALISIEIEALLTDQGFESFDWATTPRQALHCAKGHRPDLITADLRIVDGTGLEAVDAILAEMGDIPVVFVTANSDLLGGQSVFPVVSKPIMPAQLAAACQRVCQQAGA
ncbi:response regulator [Phenylobacterium sp. SCN 70-31]|uniref:response regulator n=1 Tax=Phenylobacterium sp. SCN 70-31 TaxID=1660129 RepID=UPI0025FA9366|nr:response regulator [Phenylobacterium sp. SCN 70-31]